jgi:hypothetical protein
MATHLAQARRDRHRLPGEIPEAETWLDYSATFYAAYSVWSMRMAAGTRA